jgi:hypothetical protein
MNLDYKYLLDGNFHFDSRVWIYQSNRLFSINEALEIEEVISEFVRDWKSHGTPVKGAGYLFFGQFIVLMADEQATGVSGCSTDSTVRMIKEIEKKFSVSLFDRQALAFAINDRIELLPLSQLSYAFENGFIKPDTLYFNNMVQTRQELEQQWVVPVKDSWLAKRLSISGTVS